MAQTIKRTNPGDAANIFVRCILSDISDILGGFSDEDLERTVKYFDYKCPYTGEDISVEYKTKKWVLDHLIPHNRESAGLNLYGNIIVTTRETNSAKAARNYEEFIRYNTEGSDKEKEARIRKIRKFQSESGYFDKVKKIDEIKELCKREYDSIQNRLKELQDEYKSIVPIDKHILVHPINTIRKEKPKENHIVKKMSKTQAIKIFRDLGFKVYGNITFASENNSILRKYWANPPREYINGNWWLILNDIDKRELHLFFIPANEITLRKVCLRSDKPDKIDIQIYYNDYNFIDSRSKISFFRWLKKTVKY